MLDKKRIKQAFQDKKITIKSCSIDGQIQYKTIDDVLKHMTIVKDVYKITLENNKTVTATEDHNLFIFQEGKLVPIKPKENPKQIVIIDNKEIKLVNVKKIKQVKKRMHMYDLSVQDNHNFFLTNNILVCNSFAAPSKEGTIAGFTRSRGFRWTDDSLYMHLVQANNYMNLIPPDTNYPLEAVPGPWQPILLLQAMSYALYDLAILWINEEFSYSLNGISLDIQRSDKYMNVAQTIQAQVDTQLAEAKRRLHYTIGLRQNKYTMTYGGFFGPWTSGRMSVKKWVLGFGTQSGKGFN